MSHRTAPALALAVCAALLASAPPLAAQEATVLTGVVTTAADGLALHARLVYRF